MCCDPRGLRPGVPAYADTMHGFALTQGAQAEQQPGMGKAAARGYDDGVDVDFAGPQLFRNLGRRPDIAQGAQRRMTRRQGNDVGAFAGRPQPFGNGLNGGIRARLILAIGVGIAPGAEQIAQQNIPRLVIKRIHIRHPFFVLDMDLHAKAGGGGGGDPNIVRLHGTGYDNGVGSFRLGRAEIELQLTGLVAAEGQAGQIIALDEQVQAQFRRQPWRGFYHCRQDRQGDAGIVVQTAKFRAHGVTASNKSSILFAAPCEWSEYTGEGAGEPGRHPGPVERCKWAIFRNSRTIQGNAL